MTATDRWRWERALVVLTLLLGVVAMHCLVMPMGADQTMPAATATAGPHPGGGPVPGPLRADPLQADPLVAGPGAADPAAGPAAVAAATVPAVVEQMMHLCLAVLTVLIVLGLWTVSYLVATGCAAGRGPRLPAMAAMWPRAPPPTAVRLAQLCVLRN